MTGADLFRAGAFGLMLSGLLPLVAGAQLIQIDPLSGSAPAPSADAANGQNPAFVLEGRGRDAPPVLAMPDPALAARLVPLRLSSPRIDALQTPRLQGEVARQEFILFLPAAPGATELRLSTQSGIDLLPEASTLQVTVNGTVLGQIVPDNFAGFAEDILAVPDGVLQAGRNIIEIEARQTHRIACGPDASFALWSEIDTAISGVPMPSAAFNADALGFLSAIAAQAALGQPIRIRRPDPDASMIDAAPFIGQVASALGGTPPMIESASYWPLAGLAPELARITAFPAGEGPSEPRFERGGDGAIVLVLDRGADYAAISAGLVAATRGPAGAGIRTLTTGAAQPLSALQPQSLTGEGHYILLSVPFQLPWDWLLLASQDGRLDLDYRFAEGLADGALMLVKINGVTVQVLPLDISGGMDLPTLPISFGARLLHPGTNHLAFEVLVPGDPVDRACSTATRPVVEIAPSSLLFVPDAPGMSLPSIDRSLAGVSLDQISLTDAALASLPPGFLPQVAAALAAPQGTQPSGEAGRLTIGTLADLETLRAPRFGDGLRALARALTQERLRNLDRPRQTGATAWDAVPGADGADTPPAAGLATLPQRLVSALSRMALGGGQSLDVWLADRTAQAILVQPDPERAGEIWLIIGPQAVPQEIARSLGASRGGVGGPTGQVAIFTAARTWQSWAAPDRPLRLHDPLTFENFRDAMGNYATHKPLGYLAIIFGLTLLSAAAALVLLLVTRGRR